MKKGFYSIVFLIVIIGCKDKAIQENVQVTEDGTEIENNTTHENANTKTTFQLLQGTWVNVEDPRSSLVFEDSRVKNRYDGIGNDTNIRFSVGNTCSNGSNPDGSEEVDKYISTTGDAKECYYIINLSKESLMLSFLGRGNTLTFKKD